VARVNRFAVLVDVRGKETLAHLPNSGRLGELLVPGARVWVIPQPSELRRTAWDLALVDAGGELVSVDSRMANLLVAAGLACGAFSELCDYPVWRCEVRVGASRLDFMLQSESGSCFVEAKNVTLVQDRRALFPDAPTLRGARHLRELTRCVLEGDRAAVLFIVQRGDADSFSPNRPADPPFASALEEAAARGVVVAAYRSQITLSGMRLGQPIPVYL